MLWYVPVIAFFVGLSGGFGLAYVPIRRLLLSVTTVGELPRSPADYIERTVRETEDDAEREALLARLHKLLEDENS